MRVKVDRAAKLADIKAYRAELEALTPVEPPTRYSPDWYERIPPCVNVYVNALAGEVFVRDAIPQRQWLADWDADATAAQ